MKLSQNQFTGRDIDKAGRATPGSTYIAYDTKKVYVYDHLGIPRLASSSGSGGGVGTGIIVDVYTSLPTGEDEDTLGFVVTTTGTKWLPGGLGGTYRPQGWYIYKSGTWTSIEVPIDVELNNLAGHTSSTSNPHSVTKSQVGLSNVDNTSDINKPISTATQTGLDGKANTIHTHTKSDITDFVETDYATGAEGDLATSAAQPGDNISIFVNDEVYLQPGDNVSAFVNDAGYITSATLTSFRSDFESGTVIYSGYLLDSVITITKWDDGVVTYAQGLTNLETDWTNRLSLTYL